MGKFASFLFGFVLTAHAGNSADVIYGDDDRQDLYQVDAGLARLADSTVAIVSTSELKATDGGATLLTIPFGETLPLCTSERFYTQPTAGRCSGFLVAPDLVLTAGHCMSDDSSCANSKFIFGFAMHDATQAEWQLPESDIYGCSRIVKTITDTTTKIDFAIVQLDRPVTGHIPLAYRTDGAPQVGDPMVVMGHPEGLPLKIAGNAKVRAVNDVYFVANLDTYGGNSGSAVFNAQTGLVEGILVRGDDDWVQVNGCFVSHRCPDDGCTGESSTRLSQVLPYLITR